MQHYVARGLMKKIDTVDDLAKEMGLPVSKIQGTFDDYMAICKDPKKDPFGKKFFCASPSSLSLSLGRARQGLELTQARSSAAATNWGKNAGPFHVAIMSPVLH